MILMLNLILRINLFRLVRVRQRQEYHRGTSMIAGRNRSPSTTGVALFDDYAVVDRHSQSFFIGSLSRMVHAGSHGRQEYKRPVPYDDPKRESITCYFQVYQNVQENDHDGIYKIGASELRQLPFTDILTQVNLTVSEDGTLRVPDDELTEIRSGVARVFESQPRRRRATTTTSAPRTEGELSHSLTHDEGIVRLQVQPEQQSDGGPRRSTRVRTVLLYDP